MNHSLYGWNNKIRRYFALPWRDRPTRARHAKERMRSASVTGVLVDRRLNRTMIPLLDLLEIIHAYDEARHATKSHTVRHVHVMSDATTKKDSLISIPDGFPHFDKNVFCSFARRLPANGRTRKGESSRLRHKVPGTRNAHVDAIQRGNSH